MEFSPQFYKLVEYYLNRGAFDTASNLYTGACMAGHEVPQEEYRLSEFIHEVEKSHCG